jgi:predicted O-methyltransferase YrrM
MNLCKQTEAKIIAEVGVYKGGSLKYLSENFPDAEIIYGFDTFEGLPKEYWNENEIHKPGEFSETSKEDVEKFINDPRVWLIKGLFPKIADDVFVNTNFDFVHIDTDFYQSVKENLEWFWPRMYKGGIIVFDDYEWPNCPGVKQALEEFGQPINKSANYQAYLIKQ